MNRKKPVDAYRPPEDALWLLPLGGSGEIGMNLNLYGTEGQWLMVDCGIMFPDETTPGIEIITPDISFIAQRRDDLVGIVITHAHEDHLGAIDKLWGELRCPVYAGPFAAAVLRAKFAQSGLLAQIPVREIPCGGSFQVGPFSVEMIPVTHSVPESAMLAITTVHGTVVHTGDWKFDSEPLVGRLTDEARLKEIGQNGVMALVGDSTGALNAHETLSEKTVQNSLREVFKKYKYRIGVTCFASNIARLKSISLAARDNGRYVSLVGRSLWRNAEIAESLGYLPEFSEFLSEHEAMQAPREKIVMICTGCQGETRAALSRIAVFDHPVVRFDRDDVVIYSSRDIPGNEKAIARVRNLLLKQRVDVVTSDHALVHASGHGGQPEMRKLYDLLRPRLAVPVHGELIHQIEHARLARGQGVETTMVPSNGHILRLGPGVCEKVAEIEAGKLGLDGLHLRALDKKVAQHRIKMGFSGVAVVTLALDRRGLATSDPQITLLGIDDEKALAALRGTLIDALLDALESQPRAVLLDDRALKDLAVKTVRRHLHETQGKKPIVEVHLIRV